MAGSFYVCGHIDTWHKEGRQRGRKWIQVYKRFRHLLVKDFYRLLPQPQSDADWDAAQFCDGEREGIVFAFRYRGRLTNQRLLLESTDETTTYNVRDEASGREQAIAGSALAHEGLAVELNPIAAKLFSYKRQ